MAEDAKPGLDKSKLVLIWIPIIVALIGAAATILVVFLPNGELPTIVFMPNPPLEQARQLVDEGNDGDALPYIEEAIELDPTNPQSYLLEAEIMLRQNRQPEAVQALDAGTKAVPKPLRKTMRDTRTQAKKSPVDGYIGISTAYEKFGLWEIAMALLKRVCEELPEESRLREALGQIAKESAAIFNGSAYQVFDIGMTWYEAKAYCENMGGYLVTITSQEEQEHIFQLISSESKEAYWLGAKRSDNDWDEWEWISGEMFAYTNWADWEPNGSGAYMQMFAESGRWDDTLADVNYEGGQKYWNIGFICEWSSASN